MNFEEHCAAKEWAATSALPIFGRISGWNPALEAGESPPPTYSVLWIVPFRSFFEPNLAWRPDNAEIAVMACESDLKILLKAMDEGVLVCPAVAEAGRTWLASGEPSLMEYLVERGLITQQQIQRFEAALNLRPNGSCSEASSTPSTIGAESAAISTGPSLPGPERYFQFRSFRKGGPGQVWLAWDNALGREVVVQSLRPDLAKKPAMLSQFIREARITGQLEHPNIIPVYDLIGAGPNAENWAYSMRFLGGPTLAEAIDHYHERLANDVAGPLDLVSLLDSFVLLCKAVAFAHSRQVIHRDLKGQNVVLGDFGEVTLVGWGHGKKLPGAEPEAPSDGKSQVGSEAETLQGFGGEPLTPQDAIIGTAAYMSLEVASGEPATKASDIYSLGAILFEILTGSAPYQARHAAEILEQVKKAPPPLPRSRNPSISPALEAITLKAMGRTPKDRYAGAEILADDVRRWLADLPVSVYRDSLAVRMFRWACKHRTASVAAAALFLTAAVSLSVGSALIRRERPETSKQKVEAETSFKMADELNHANADAIEKSDVHFLSNQELFEQR